RPARRRARGTPYARRLAEPWARQGVATQVAATLLATTGDNPGRTHTEASFTALYGASPVDASSGKQIRHPLNRDGGRQEAIPLPVHGSIAARAPVMLWEAGQRRSRGAARGYSSEPILRRTCHRQ